MGKWNTPARVTQRKIILTPGTDTKGERPPHCVKCGVEVEPGLAYCGKVLESHSSMTREKALFLPATLEYTIEQYRIPIASYAKGFICDECAGDCSLSKGKPVVVVEMRANVTPRDERVGPKSQKGFNTRITR